jgi:hypothetical protein
MEIIKSTNGFPYAWKAGRIEQLIRSILEDKIRRQIDCKRAMIINPTWLHENNLIDDIEKADPDFILCHNFVDPAVPKIFEAIEQSGRPFVLLGNSRYCRLDFWAMVAETYFKQYTEADVEYNGNKKFICLNRKPHPHRRRLVEYLLSHNLKDQGVISLGLPGEGALLVDNTEFDEHNGTKDEYGNLGVDSRFVSGKILNDIFTLGDLDNWRSSYLCLVTETEFINPELDNFFTSEKTFKPMIGMRPFFVYGQPRLREFLKEQGFDVFEDYFDYSSINHNLGDVGLQEEYARVAVEGINNLQDAANLYRRDFGRLQNNKKMFTEYSQKQWIQLMNLDLNQYVVR